MYQIRCLGIEVYKCFHGLNPDYLNKLFKAVICKIRHDRFAILSSLNSTLSHVGRISFDTIVLSFRIFCHIHWKIQKPLTYSKIISRDGATVNSLCVLVVFWNHVRLPLCLYFNCLFIPLSKILVYTWVYTTQFSVCVSIHHVYLLSLCTC